MTALFTTRADKALPLWEDNVDHIYYYKEDLPEHFPEISEVYFRDPFNDRTFLLMILELMKLLSASFVITSKHIRLMASVL